MTAPGAYPDTEAVLIGWLAAQLAPTLVLADLPPNLEDVLPVVQITGLPGQVDSRGWNGDRWLTGRPRFDVDAFAATREQASDLCRDVEALLATLPGTQTGGTVVAQVVEELGPERRPDYNPNVRRYGATYGLVIRPTH